MPKKEKNLKRKVTGKRYRSCRETAVQPDYITGACQQAEQEDITENSEFPDSYSENLHCREKFPVSLNQAGKNLKIKSIIYYVNDRSRCGLFNQNKKCD